jgi:hypothetical protein
MQEAAGVASCYDQDFLLSEKEPGEEEARSLLLKKKSGKLSTEFEDAGACGKR